MFYFFSHKLNKTSEGNRPHQLFAKGNFRYEQQSNSFQYRIFNH